MTKRSPKAFVDLFVRTLRKPRIIDVQQTLATQTNEGAPGLSFSEARETDAYTVSHTVEDGIERVAYEPKNRRFETPILMQHGMWHGAWCWQHWQELFAEWGWASTAYSLPGHAKSPVQRPIISCTLDYYLAFLKWEVERLPLHGAPEHVGVTVELVADGGADEVGAVGVKAVLHEHVYVPEIHEAEIDRDLLAVRELGSRAL